MTREPLGFIGLGVMGQPMALNLAHAGNDLVVWNRSPDRAEPLLAAGAQLASSVDEVFARARVVLVMLVNEEVTDDVLGRATPVFAERVCGHVVVSMGTTSPGYSRALSEDIRGAGGQYVEAPVSGSRKPAEAGDLVALVGGDRDPVAEVVPLLTPMCRQTILCGPAGSALLMKLAVNLYLATMLVGLAEAVHFADRNGLDLGAFQTAIESGQMASAATRAKLPKLIARDFSVHAAASDAYTNTRLIAEAARAADAATPLLDLSSALYGETVQRGNGRMDMVSVIEAIEGRTKDAPGPTEGSRRLAGAAGLRSGSQAQAPTGDDMSTPPRVAPSPARPLPLFGMSERAGRYLLELLDFMDSHVYPAEAIFKAQMREAGHPNHHPQVLEDLKLEARRRGLWNLFHPDPEFGPGLTNLEYAPLAEVMGRSPHLAPEACNCNAPDTGNMEVLSVFGSPEHKERWLTPLLAGTIRSAFAMTEPDTASSDATNIELRIERDGNGYLLNGRKWLTSNAMHQNCRVLIVMGKTDPGASAHRQQSMAVLPIDAPGVTVVRDLPVFGYHDREGHAEITFEDVRIPTTDLLVGEGEGFAISQARLGPGRIHHCMRAIGMAERALELLCSRALARTTFGAPLSERANIQDWIAEARIELEKSRLLTLKTAWLMDTVGNREARTEIAAIKVDAPNVALRIVDRAIQVHGGAGVTDDVPLASFWAHLRALRIADGPDEVHKRTIALRELNKHRVPGLVPR